MPTRVSPTDRLRGEIDALFTADRDLAEVLEDVARLGARLILQTALEIEVTEFLGRDRYARGDRARPGHRNGYAFTTVKTHRRTRRARASEAARHRHRVASPLLGKHVTKWSGT